MVTTILATGLLTSCGGGDGDGAAPPDPPRSATGTGSGPAGPGCGPVVVEALDPRSTQHLLPGAPPPDYAGDPPTSGPHVAAPEVSGLQTVPVAEPVQVGVLEAGGVMVQHRPDLPPGDRARLASLAGPATPAAGKVVVAPNPELKEPVVATAWRHRLSCRSLDLAALRAFVAERAGKGPD